MPRYALLRHDCPADFRDGPHWDLMLEREGVLDEYRLATWSLLELPAAWRREATGHDANPTVEITPLADHRATYLDYEGPLSGGRGTVGRVAGGQLAWVDSEPDRIVVELLEGPIAGRVSLFLNESGQWRLSVTPVC